jgi:lipid II:glycine glycyltransferase (peptidoglycan interpeptide bridge formation enzyme)
MDKKDIYTNLCKEKNIPLFSQSWWLDIVSGNSDWELAMVANGKQVIAAFPYMRVGKSILNPILTSTSHLYFEYDPNQKYSARIGFELKQIQKLIDDLPDFDYFEVKFHPNLTNHLPFYWMGFEQSTRFTYIIPDTSDPDNLFSSFESKARNEIRKAEKRGVRISDKYTAEDFFRLLSMTFERQNLEPPYTFEVIKEIIETAAERNCGKMFFAEDDDQKLHSGIFIIWDEDTVYYLLSGSDPNLRSSGSLSLLVWESIKIASAMEKSFDFEGSMIKPVESFVRGFATIQQPYLNIIKYNSRASQIKRGIRNILGK